VLEADELALLTEIDRLDYLVASAR